MNPRISVIAALSSDGQIWLSLTQANNNSNMMDIYFRQLTKVLEKQNPNFRESVVLVIDGAVSVDAYAKHVFSCSDCLTFCLLFLALPPKLRNT